MLSNLYSMYEYKTLINKTSHVVKDYTVRILVDTSTYEK